MTVVDPPSLPGDIPGLLRQGSPITWRGGETGTVHRLGRGGEVLFVADDTLHTKDLASVVKLPYGLALDLSEITGRQHANWWLGNRNVYPDGKALWLGVRFELDEQGLEYALSNDKRMLPDGSRWIQAETLRRVCLRVAERDYPPDIPLYRDYQKEALDRIKALIPAWQTSADEYDEDGDARLCTLDCINELKEAIRG